jgi:hypothetical protein
MEYRSSEVKARGFKRERRPVEAGAQYDFYDRLMMRA